MKSFEDIYSISFKELSSRIIKGVEFLSHLNVLNNILGLQYIKSIIIRSLKVNYKNVSS